MNGSLIPRIPLGRSLTLSPRRETSSLPWAVGMMLFLVLLQFLPESWTQLLPYQRIAVGAGEWWRLFTGNLVHVGWAHLALNLAAMSIGTWLFAEYRTPLGWAAALLVCGLSVNLGLYWFSPDIYWCVGMSGVLHGFMLIGALDWATRGERLGIVLLVLWVGKVAWEQAAGVPMSEDLVGEPVVVDAHLWGLLGGLAYVLGEAGWRRHHRRV